MTKLQDIATVADQIDRDTDLLYAARSLGGSPEAFQDIQVPAAVLDIGTIYDFGMSFDGTPQGQFVRRAVVARKLVVPADFANAYGWVSEPPDAQFDMTMRLETPTEPAPADVAAISISTGGVFTFSMLGSPQAPLIIPAGSRVSWFYDAGGGSPLAPDQGIFDIDIVIGARVSP